MPLFKKRRPDKDDRVGNFLWELENRPQAAILPSDVVKFSDPLRAVFNRVTRMGQITSVEASELLDLSSKDTQKVINYIVETGFLRAPSLLDDENVYQTRLAVHTRRREDVIPKDILSKLDDL